MGLYDISLKDIFRRGGRHFLKTLEVRGPLKQLDTDLSSVKERRVDFLAQMEGPTRLLHIEFQASVHEAMGFRMLSYLGSIVERLSEDEKLLGSMLAQMKMDVRQIVVYVGRKSWNVSRFIDLPTLKYEFEFVDVRNIDAGSLVREGDVGDAVLAVLCRGGASRASIQEIIVRTSKAPVSERADAIARLIALASLRDVRAAVEREVRDMGLQFNLADSDLLREPIDRAHREGFEAGEHKGVAKGYAATIVTLLSLSFGSDELPEGLMDHLADLQPDVLATMVARIQSAPSVEHVLGSHMPAPGHSHGR